MNRNSIAVALSLCAVMALSTAAPAQRKKTVKRRATVARKVVKYSGAETGLVGIRLFDTGSRVVSVYGSPDEIQSVSFGGTMAGPGGGAAGGPGGAGLPMGAGAPSTPRGGGPRGGGPGGVGAAYTFPGDFSFGDSTLDRQTATLTPPPGKGGGGGGGRGGMSAGGVGGASATAPPLAGGGGGPAMGGGGMSGGNAESASYTRWVYNRNASKYGFIVDKYNRVIQLEAIGIQHGKASTRRGITFGSSFAQIINKYGAPDGYEIAGDNIVVRYLSKAKCAFRLSRLGENKPSVVTGIVVAAGKR